MRKGVREREKRETGTGCGGDGGKVKTALG